MSVYSDHAAHLDALQAEYSEPSLVFTWNGADYLILPGGGKFKRRNDRGGFALENDLQLTCTTAQFGDTLPDSGQQIIYDGVTYIITFITTAPAGYQIRINADLFGQE